MKLSRHVAVSLPRETTQRQPIFFASFLSAINLSLDHVFSSEVTQKVEN